MWACGSQPGSNPPKIENKSVHVVSALSEKHHLLWFRNLTNAPEIDIPSMNEKKGTVISSRVIFPAKWWTTFLKGNRNFFLSHLVCPELGHRQVSPVVLTHVGLRKKRERNSFLYLFGRSCVRFTLFYSIYDECLVFPMQRTIQERWFSLKKLKSSPHHSP